MKSEYKLSALFLGLFIATGCGSSDDKTVDPVDTPDPIDTMDPEPIENDAPLGDPSVQWSTTYPGSLIGRLVIAGDEQTVVTLSRNSDDDDRIVLTGIDPATGTEKFSLSDVYSPCYPAMTPSGDVVVLLDGDTALGGNDSSNDIALIDSDTGEIIDQWAPGGGSFSPCLVDFLKVSPNGIVFATLRNSLFAFTANETSLEPLWNRVFNDDDADAFQADRNTSAGATATVVLGERLYVFSRENRNDGTDQPGITVYQLDAATGSTVGRFDTELNTVSGAFAAGPDHLLLIGTEPVDNLATAVLLTGAGNESADNSLALGWSRGFDGNLDGVTESISNDSIALQPGAIGSWSSDSTFNGITEFDLSSGMLNHITDASSFSNNDSIVALPNGGYAISPFGGNFIEATDGSGDGQLDWRIETVEGFQFPQAHGLYGETLVIAAEHDEGWAFVGIGPIMASEE